MRGNNKGYSLFELLVSIAIFAVVMLGIISIMSSTSVLYRNGQQEVTLQEEAQLVLNQIENILVDSTGAVTEIQPGFYTVVKGSELHGIKKEDDKLFYAKGVVGDDMTAASVAWSPMADYVKDFEINGLTYSATRDSGDNRAQVILSMENAKYAYSGQKDVFFRNATENMTNYLIDAGSSTPDPSSGAFDKFVVIRRFEEFSLLEECGIVSDFAWIDNGATLASTYYNMTELTVDGNGMTNYIITPGTIINGNMSDAYEKDMMLGASGKDIKGNVVKVCFEVEPVEFKSASAVMPLTSSYTTNSGTYIWVETKGIDMRNVSGVQYTGIFYNDVNNDHIFDATGGDTMYNKKENIGLYQGDNISNVGTSASQEYYSGSGTKVMLGLAACPESGHLMITTGNPSATNGSTEAINFFNEGNKRINFAVTVQGVVYHLDYAVTYQGMDISNVK